MNENVNVCITPKGDKPVLHFSQYDNERVFTVTVLADDGESAAVLTGLDIEFRLRKTDSHVVTIAPESVADNVITFKTTEQMCACCGQNIASVVLMKDDMIVSTLDILVDIQRDILSGGLTSESDIRNLTTQIEQIVPEVIGDDYYNKQEVDDLLAEHTFDPSNYYDKQEVDDLLAEHTFDPSNYYDKSDVDDLLEDKADKSAIASLIVQKDVAKAPIASFNTDLAEDLTKIIVDINPVQDLHGYSKPWSGGGGKNKFNDTTGTHTINANTDTTITIGDVYLEANTTYTISCKQTPAPLTSFVRNTLSVFGNGTTIYNPAGNDYTIKPMVFTPTVSGTYSIRVWGHTLSDTTTYSQFQVEVGSTATSYEPYSNICPISGFSALNVTLADGDMQTVDTKTVNFGQTVYGGVADVTNGKVTITHVIKNIGENDISDNGTSGGLIELYVNGTSNKKNGQTNMLCNNLEVRANSSAYVIRGRAGSSNVTFCLPTSDVPDFNSAKTWVTNNPIELVYELATPIEITTTPENLSALSGQNNVYGDTNGDTEVRFTETIGNELGV